MHRLRLPRFNISQKFFVFLLLSSVIPLILVGSSTYRAAENLLQQEAARANNELVRDQRDYLDLQLQQTESLIGSLAAVDEVLEALVEDGSTSDYTRLATQARIGYLLDGFRGLDGLVSIDVFSLDGKHYHVGDTLDVSRLNRARRDALFLQAVRAGGKVTWIGLGDNINSSSSQTQVITAARTLTGTNANSLLSRTIGMLLVNTNVEPLYRHFSQVDMGDGGILMVVDENNRLIYHPDHRLLGASVSANFMSNLSGSSGSLLGLPEAPDTLITYQRSNRSGWMVVSLVPLQVIAGRMGIIRLQVVLVMALAFLLVTGSAWLITRDVVRPLRVLANRIQGLQEGRLTESQPLPVTVSDEVGELMQLVNSFQETLAARHNAEEALRESEERYSLAMRGANDGLFDWDLRSGTVHYSNRWKAILGYEDEEIGNTPEDWYNRVHPEDLPAFRAALDAHLRGKTPFWESEHRLRLRSGQVYRWVLARGLAVRDEYGQALRMAGSLTDITPRRIAEDRLRWEALHDSLTNLPNRTYFMDQLRRCIDRASRSASYRAAVLFLDLDRFKIVNDSLGHSIGDQMLVIIAHRLTSCLRAGDTVARFGGDEFAVLLEDIQADDEPERIASRLQETLSSPLSLQGRDVFTTASIGIAMITNQGRPAEDLLRDADTAMYQAKSRGRARYAIYGDEMHASTMAQLQLEAEMRRALERQEFVLHYQPIISLETGQVNSLEALIRWQSPRGDLVQPGDFITLAEETGLIVPIGEWVLRTACAQLRIWRAAGWSDLTISVNLSARQLQDGALPRLVQHVLEENDLPGCALQLEVTESAAMQDLELTVQILGELNGMGVRSAVDDFGNSYSSLGYLKRLPVATLKIDKSFIHEAAQDADSAAITTAIVAMAHILGLQAVAEGVETPAQSRFLADQGCDEAQGYLFSRPQPAANIPEILARGFSAELAMGEPGS